VTGESRKWRRKAAQLQPAKAAAIIENGICQQQQSGIKAAWPLSGENLDYRRNSSSQQQLYGQQPCSQPGSGEISWRNDMQRKGNGNQKSGEAKAESLIKLS